MTSRDIIAALILALGFILWLGKPLTWKWPDIMGPWPIRFFTFCQDFSPIPIIVCFVFGVVLFATRKKY